MSNEEIKEYNEEIKEYRDYAWKYFSIHADQRLKTFHFFVVLSAIISGAIITITKDVTNIAYAAPMSYLLSFLAFIFWKLDQRNRELIKNGENVLKAIERKYTEDDRSMSELQLFLVEEEKTNNKSLFPSVPLLDAHFSYSNCFNLVFFVFGVGSFVIGTILLASACA